MAKKMTSNTAEGGTQSTTGRSEQQIGTVVQQAPKPKRATPKRPAGPTHEQIAQRAEAIWKRHGCPPNEEMDNWLKAEAELKQEMGLQ